MDLRFGGNVGIAPGNHAQPLGEVRSGIYPESASIDFSAALCERWRLTLEDQYISEGLNQELAAELGQLPVLKVVSGGSRAQAGDADVRQCWRESST